MQPHELIALLVRDTGKSALQVATEMDKASFQGTLHKFMAGKVPTPSQPTAAKIARYFDLPTDALYDSDLATKVAATRGLMPLDRSAVALVGIAREPKPGEKPADSQFMRARFSIPLEQRIAMLTADQLRRLESLIEVYLESVAPALALSRRYR